jgi:tetratricopeptide (TPR) repeat protein
MKTRREMLEEFVEQDPGDSFSRYALALELEKEGRTVDAIAVLQEVIDRDSSYVAAYFHLGRLLAISGDNDRARGVYSDGIRVAEQAGDSRTKAEIEEAIELLG